MEGKRVSWVELYVDLVFVLAIGQIAHLIVAEPEPRSVWIALGLFFVLWWTWVGFAVLYNRHGADEPLQRLLFLAGSVPAGVAAVAVEPAATGDSTVFAISLAVTRLVLAVANGQAGGRTQLLQLRITRPLLTSAALHVDTTGGWTALVAAMVLAGALWWLYFDSVADVNLRVLELSGGSPTMARAIFAVGHMLPAFALLITASGVGLLLEDDPPRIAYGFACTGVALYMLGTRVIRMGSGRVPAPVRVLLVVATFALARLFHGLSGSAYLWLLTGWVLMVAALTTRTGASDDETLARFLPPDRPERQGERRAKA